MWIHYLLGKNLALKIDHHGLMYFFFQCQLSAHQIRWMELISDYNFEINYISGKENQVGDALNCR